MAVTERNGDGVPDVLIGGNTAVLGIAYGPLAGKDGLTVERVWPKGKEPFQYMTTNPSVADRDGDGLADLIVGGDRGKTRGVYWLRNIGTKREPKLTEPKLLIADEGNCSTTGIWVADWNDDGRPDLIASRQEMVRVTPTGGAYAVRQHQVWVYLRQTR